MLSIPTPASGHSFFCLTAFVVKKKVNIRSQVRNFSHQWSSQMKSRFLLRKGKQKNTAGEFLATCHHVPYMPHPEVTCLVGRSATCQMAHLWTGLEIASIIQRPLDLILMLQASCSGDFQGNPNLATLRIRDMSAGVSKPPVLKPHGLGGFGVSIGGGSGFFQGTTKTTLLADISQNFVQYWTSTWPPDLLTGGPKTCLFYFVFLVDAESTGAKCDNSMTLLDHPKAT